MIHTYISGNHLKDGHPMVIIGLTEEDIQKGQTKLAASGSAGLNIDASKHCPLHAAILIGKTQEDLIALVEKVTTGKGGPAKEITVKDVKEDR